MANGDIKMTTTYDFLDGNGPVPAHRHCNGGGWVADTAKVADTAFVRTDAMVYGNAKVSGNAAVYGNATVYGDTKVYDDAMVYGNAQVYGKAAVYGDTKVSCDAKVYNYVSNITPKLEASNSNENLLDLLRSTMTDLGVQNIEGITDQELLDLVNLKMRMLYQLCIAGGLSKPILDAAMNG